jgi:hypothetical protein
VKEEEALAVLLRPLSGYTMVRRATPAPQLSQYDRIVLLPRSESTRDTALSTPTAPTFNPPPPPQQTVMINGVARLIGPNGALVEDDQVDAPPPQNPARGFTRGDAPAVPPQVVPPAQPGQPSTPTVVGSPTPGMVVNPPSPGAAPPQAPVQR